MQQPVERFDKEELVDAAAQVYTEIADHNPQITGKNKAYISVLQRMIAIYARLAMPDLRQLQLWRSGTAVLGYCASRSHSATEEPI